MTARISLSIDSLLMIGEYQCYQLWVTEDIHNNISIADFKVNKRIDNDCKHY